MNKYIFLDIDGVLAIPDSLYELDINKQNLLGYILKRTHAKIILTSSWRKHTLEDTKEYLKEKGFIYIDSIIDITIRAYHYIDRTQKIHLSIPRGVEIKQWIDTHIHSDNGNNFERKIPGKDFQYVIIDDDAEKIIKILKS
jgi:hypothetical protein